MKGVRSLTPKVRAWPALVTPTLVGLVWVASAYGETAMHWTVMVRPVAVSTCASALLTGLVWVIVRRPVIVGTLATAAVLLVQQQVNILALVVCVVAGVLAYQQWRRMHGLPLPITSPSALLIPATLLLVTTLLDLVAGGAVSLADFAGSRSTVVAGEGQTGYPSIYVLMLDGYPRNDTLAQELGFDNAAFASALRARGFTINPDSRSRYRRTELTLSSSHLSDAEQLAEFVVDDSDLSGLVAMRRQIRRERLVNDPLMDAYRELGYHLAYIPSPIGHTDWAGWDETRATGWLTDFEALLIQRTLLRPFLGGWVMDQQRGRVDESLQDWARTAGSDQELVFAHVMAPHPPFLWGAGGEELGPLPCWFQARCNLFHATTHDLDLSADEYRRLIGPQIVALNERVLAAIDRILSMDREAIVVLFSDHGARYLEPPTDEWHRTLLAGRGVQVKGPDGLFVHLLDAVKRSVPQPD